MVAQEQNKLLDITKFVKFIGSNNECYINPNYISRIYKTMYDDYYTIEISGTLIPLNNVQTKAQLNKFLDYIYYR